MKLSMSFFTGFEQQYSAECNQRYNYKTVAEVAIKKKKKGI